MAEETRYPKFTDVHEIERRASQMRSEMILSWAQSLVGRGKTKNR